MRQQPGQATGSSTKTPISRSSLTRIRRSRRTGRWGAPELGALGAVGDPGADRELAAADLDLGRGFGLQVVATRPGSFSLPALVSIRTIASPSAR